MSVFAESPNSWDLSTPIKTRQTRQIESNPLIPISKLLSGWPDFPTNNPTFSSRLPDIFVLIIWRLRQDDGPQEMQDFSGGAREGAPDGERFASFVYGSQ